MTPVHPSKSYKIIEKKGILKGGDLLQNLIFDGLVSKKGIPFSMLHDAFSSSYPVTVVYETFEGFPRNRISFI